MRADGPSVISRRNDLRDRQWAAWDRGERLLVEALVAEVSQPLLESELLELIFAEVTLRSERGESCQINEYLQRFPQFAESLRKLFDSHDALENSNAAAAATAETFLQPTNSAKPPDEVLADAHPHAQRLPPTRLGRYHVQDQLGAGAFGAVYRGWDDELQRTVAIKVPHAAAIEAFGGSQAYVTEARRLAQLKHPGIVAIYDIGQGDDGQCFLVSEFIEGHTLSQTLKQSGRPSPAVAVPIAIQIAEALQHAHKRGFVHRDLKPANILMDHEGKPHILDFGLALHENEQAQRAGEIAGTLAYMSPEQTIGEAHNLDGRSDIWALGVILYEMLTGRRPFQGDSAINLVQQIRERPPRPLRMLDETLPAELERITLKCLEKSTTARYSSAQDLLEDLRAWQNRPIGAVVEPVPNAKPIRTSRLVAGVAASALAIIGIVWAFRPPSKPSGVPAVVPAVIAQNVEPTTATPGPLEVAEYRTIHYRDQAGRSQRLGEVGLDTQETLVLDGVRCLVKFNQPAYAYLVACNADGTIQLCSPDSQTSPPQKLQSFEYPARPDEAFYLTEGTGQQAFALVTSLDPLPSFQDWRTQHGNLAWSHSEPAMVVRFRCGLKMKSAVPIGEPKVRGMVAPLKGISAVRDLAESLSRSQNSVLVEAIGFPVLPGSSSHQKDQP